MTQVTKEFELATIKKITVKLVPLMVLIYLVAYIDRQNIGFAKLQMVASLGISEAAFGLGASLFFVGYLLFEVPSNLFMARYGARIWFSRILATWGIVTLLLAYTSNVTMFYILRFLLGAAEAGLYPGLIYFISQWFPLAYRARIYGFLVAAMLMANLIGGPINGSLLTLDGFWGYEGWQWVFLGTGCLAMVTLPVIFFKFPSTPDKANFLTEEEKNWILTSLEAEKKVHIDHSVKGVFRSLTDIRVLMISVILLAVSFGAYGTTYWMPTILNSFGASDLTNGFLNALPWIIGVVVVWVLTKKPREDTNPYYFIVLPLFITSICMALSALFSHIPVVSFGFLCIALPALYCVQPCMWTLTKFLTGPAAAVGIATVNSLGNFGGFFGQNTVPLVRDMTGSVIAPVMFMSVVIFIIAICTIFITRYFRKVVVHQP